LWRSHGSGFQGQVAFRRAIREQAMLNCRSGYPSRLGALPLSYGRIERPAGFEPATTRLTAEVSDIFTTDRTTNGVPGNDRDRTASCEAPCALPRATAPLGARKDSNLRPHGPEVTALFTTGKGSLGNSRHRLSVSETRVLRVATEDRSPRHAGPRGTSSTARIGNRRVSKPASPRAM
jgi:hypothetical protein